MEATRRIQYDVRCFYCGSKIAYYLEGRWALKCKHCSGDMASSGPMKPPPKHNPRYRTT